MGDSSLMTMLSVVPLLIIAVAIAAAGIAWLSGRRAVRTVVGILLVVVGISGLFVPIVMAFSMAGGALIALVGVVLLIAEYGPRRAG
jgi:hypothetical protein